jgi:hypothetical protein
MELELQSLFVLSCSQWLRPRNLGSYTRSLLVRQDRRHLFMTPWPGSVSIFTKWSPSSFAKTAKIPVLAILNFMFSHRFKSDPDPGLVKGFGARSVLFFFITGAGRSHFVNSIFILFYFQIKKFF